MIKSVSHLYRFQFGGTPFRFNNENEEITFGGEVYLPAIVSHTAPEQSGEELSGNIVVRLDYTEIFPANFLENYIAIAPAGLTSLSIFEFNENASPEGTTIWVGSLNSISLDDGGVAQLLCKPLSSIFVRQGPRMTRGTLCNNQFTDQICRVVAGNFTAFNRAIISIANNGVDFTVTGLSSEPDGTFVGGKCINAANALDTRLIIKHVGDVITVQYPFQSLAGGEDVDVLQGCDHTLRTCKDKFDNLLNFAGAPYTPRQNPFDVGFDRL